MQTRMVLWVSEGPRAMSKKMGEEGRHGRGLMGMQVI